LNGEVEVAGGEGSPQQIVIPGEVESPVKSVTADSDGPEIVCAHERRNYGDY
jgi:hypothetical protein